MLKHVHVYHFQIISAKLHSRIFLFFRLVYLKMDVKNGNLQNKSV